jgi:alpha-galactosidase
MLILITLVSNVLARDGLKGPPMGFNTWNHLKCDINESIIKETADLFATSGLKDAGYEYVNLDDCWALRERDPVTNRMVADPEKFPSGLKALGEYIHSKGLKFGIYSDSGVYTCAGFPGSNGYVFKGFYYE